MKRITIILIILVFIFINGCGREKNNNKKQQVYTSTAPKIMFDKIISALDNKDEEELKALFATNALDKTTQIDDQIADLMDFYKGKFVSNEPFDSGSGTGIQKNGDWIYLFITPRIKELKTNEAVYSLSFNSVPVDNENLNDVGLWGIWLRVMDGDTIISECQVGTPYPGRANELND